MTGTDQTMPGGIPQNGPEDGSDAAVALDYALGVLDGDATRAAELRLRRDPAFAADVAAWQAQLAPLSDDIAPVVPGTGVWASIDRELFRAAAPAVSSVARSRWSSLSLWRSLAIGTSAVAAVALGVLVMRPVDSPVVSEDTRRVTTTPASTGRLLAASMASTDKESTVMLTATYDPDRGQVVLTPAAPENKRGLTPQLWIIVGEAPPKSLGMIDLNGAQALQIPGDMRAELKNGATLAISLEPPGGSPTGAPTGPVVATGTLGTI